MSHGEFGWFELICHDPETVRGFYGRVMGWQFYGDKGDHDAKVPLMANWTLMPPKFADMQMPAFWMSHIEVASNADTCTQAKDLGGTVEVVEKPDDNGAGFALIRDPSGAGFTVFEGMVGTPLSRRANHRCGHILFTDDPSRVAAFYEGLFGWDLTPSDTGYHIQAGTQRLEISSAAPQLRGKNSFWSVLLASIDLGPLPHQLQDSGGRLVIKAKTRYGHAAWVMDPEGAVIGFVENPALGGWRDWAFW
ncbi:MAG: VOC family protein [Pseudomonadota bacterium]